MAAKVSNHYTTQEFSTHHKRQWPRHKYSLAAPRTRPEAAPAKKVLRGEFFSRRLVDTAFTNTNGVATDAVKLAPNCSKFHIRSQPAITTEENWMIQSVMREISKVRDVSIRQPNQPHRTELSSAELSLCQLTSKPTR